MNDMIQVRRAEMADAEVIAGFNIAIARETENLTLDPNIVKEGVAGLLCHPEFGFYLVAQSANGEVAGSLMVTFEWTDWRNGIYWWVQSVYVHPDFRRQGIYRKLYQHVRETAKADNLVRGVRLYVDAHNTTAQQSYLKMGMHRSNYIMFEEMFA